MKLSTERDAEDFIFEYGDRLNGMAKYWGAQCYNDLVTVVTAFISEHGYEVDEDSDIDIKDYIITNNFWS